MIKISNIFTLIGGVFAVIQLFQTSVMATTAIQQCAGYALCCALVVIPHCISRAVKELD